MYLKWQEKTITDFSDKNINELYNNGFVFTRTGKGKMEQTRSVRVELFKFNLSSENRRILKKNDEITLSSHPIPYADYDWQIHKLGKEFYEKKFGAGVFSASKIKELITNQEKSNFNRLLVFSFRSQPIGYCIAYESNGIIHYCYPFYILQANSHQLPPNTGITMMTLAVMDAKERHKKYFYLGSAKDRASLYKFQFSGIEWFDGEKWQTDVTGLKKIL